MTEGNRRGTVAALALATCLGAAMPALVACHGGQQGEATAQGGGTDEGQGDEEQGDGFEMPAGHATTDEDRGRWTTVAGASGGVITTVIEISPASGIDIDEEALMRDLLGSRISWSHVVIGDNMATRATERAYLYLPLDSDSSQVLAAASALPTRRWKARTLGVDDYRGYLGGIDETGLTYAETTYRRSAG